jgi:murein DD-endopeptidase MepM/ murein hydrolase activator NlpD
MFYLFFIPSAPPPPPAAPPAPVPPTVQAPQLHTIEGDVKKRSTLFKSLSEKNIPLRWIDLIISKLKPYVNFKKIKGGTYHFITDVKGELVKFIYEASPTEIYEIEKDPQGYVAQRKKVSLETHLVKVVGEIRSSLFEAMDAVGEQDPLTIAFAEILAWEIDFYKDVREGDQFKVVVEKIYKGDQFIQYGTIHAVEYQRGEKIIRGMRYKDGYYNEKGISLKKAFLKAPLRFNRISSKFSRARKHPILGGVRPHYGVDYAAPPGTPIWAVADGSVTSCGWNSGFGNQVILRHKNGYMTCYGHLSSYGPGIRKGVRVRQKQIIGYVGSTGLSTGPHLDYRLVKNNQFRNPLKETFPTGLPIEKGEMEIFRQRRDEMLVWLEGGNKN